MSTTAAINRQTAVSEQKSNLIQILRAFAIIAVVLIHDCPPDGWQVYFRPFINYAVAIFLFLSGYLTKAERRDWKRFYKNRITRVLIPYVIWSLLYSVITVKDISKLPFALLTTSAYLHLYYIFVYIQFVLLTPLLIWLAKSRYRILGWLVTPVSILVYMWYCHAMGQSPDVYVALFWHDCCLGWFIFYYLGLMLGNKLIDCRLSIKTLLALYLISLPLQMAEGFVLRGIGAPDFGTQVKLTAVLTSVIAILIAYRVLEDGKVNMENRFLKLVGDYSFGIYLSHLLIRIVLMHIPYYSSIIYPVNSMILTAVSLGFCYFGNKVLGNKMGRWLGLK